MVNLNANHIEDLGDIAKEMLYEDKLDPTQNECENIYWNNRFMERNAAITKVEIEAANPKWCPDDIWNIVIEFIRQPIIMRINQDMVDLNAKSPVAITTMRSHKSLLRSITRINKEIRSKKRNELQISYDLLNVEWIATKPNPRKRDSPIIEINANGIRAVYFWQLGGAIPAAEVSNDDEFENNKECMKSPAPFRLIAYLFIKTYGTTLNRDLMVQFQLNNYAASVNVGESGLQSGGMFIYDQARTLRERRIMFEEVLSKKGLYVHQAFFENRSGFHWKENQHTFLSAFHMIRFLSNPAQTKQIELLIKRGRGGKLEMNEILKLSGDSGYELPECAKHNGANHLHFVSDKQCFGAIRPLNEYYRTLYQHLLEEEDTDGLNCINSDCIKEFTKSLNYTKDDKMPEGEYSRLLYDYFNFDAAPLRFDNWVIFVEFKKIGKIKFLGENRSDVKRKEKELKSQRLKGDSDWNSEEEETTNLPPSATRSKPKSLLKDKKDESDDEDIDLNDPNTERKIKESAKKELSSRQKADKDTLHQELSEEENYLDFQRENMIILSDDDNAHNKNKGKRGRKRKLKELTKGSEISSKKELIDLTDNDNDKPSNTSSKSTKQPPKKKRRVSKRKCGNKMLKKHQDKEEI